MVYYFPVQAGAELVCFPSAIDRLVWKLHPENRHKQIIFLSPEEYKYAVWGQELEEGV